MKANNRPRPPRPLWPYILVGLIALMLLTIASTARAEVRCGGLADVLADLRASYGELVMWQGRDRNGHQLLITANPDGTSWTALTLTDPEKVCLLTGGNHWFVGDAAPPAGKEG